MTQDEDKQRSVLILSAFNITACQQALLQTQYNGGADLLSCEEYQNCGKEVENSNNSSHSTNISNVSTLMPFTKSIFTKLCPF